MKTKNGYLVGFAIALLLGLAAGWSVAQETGSEIDSSGYLIGPGDRLQVFVWGQPELSVTVPVRPDGRVSTPLIEDIVAVGKTPTQLASEMEEVLSAYIRSPEV